MLDGVDCGFVHSAEGGGVRGEVVAQRGPDYFDRKHLANLLYEELVLRLDFSLHRTVYTWVAETLTGRAPRRDVSLADVDRDGKVSSQRDFSHVLVTEVGFPALDGSSKDPAYLTLRLAPEYTRTGTPTARPGKPSPGIPWRTGDYRLEIPGLDCTKVRAVGALTVVQAPGSDSTGEGRDPARLPTRLVFPDLTLTLPESSAQTWLAWHDDFLLKGNNTGENERQGTLTFFSSDQRAPRALGAVHLVNLGIFRLEPRPDPTGERTAELTASLYCERLELAFNLEA